MSYKDFDIKTLSEAGVKLPLYNFKGKKTGHWLKVRGVDSDAFIEANEEAIRARVALEAVSDKKEKAKLVKKIKLTLLSSLISDWSFDEPCSIDNVVDFLERSPQNAEAVDLFAARREGFIAKKSNHSGILLRFTQSLMRRLAIKPGAITS